MSEFKKSPLGVKPVWLWKEERLMDLERAIRERLETTCDIPVEWIAERNQLLVDAKK